MISLNLPRAVGPVDRGWGDRGFTRWEAHYAWEEISETKISVVIVPRGNVPPLMKMWHGQTYVRYDMDAITKKVWYWRVKE